MTFMVIFDSFAAVSQSKADCLGANKAPFSVSLNIQDSHSANFSKPVAELSEARRTDLRRVGSKAIKDLLELLHKDDPNGVMRALLNDPNRHASCQQSTATCPQICTHLGKGSDM